MEDILLHDLAEGLHLSAFHYVSSLAKLYRTFGGCYVILVLLTKLGCTNEGEDSDSSDDMDNKINQRHV